MIKKIFIAFLFLGAASMIVMSLHYFQYRMTGITKSKEIAAEFWYICLLRTHIAGGIFAMTLGPFQFITILREKYLLFHRRMGYVYFGSILISGTSGLLVAQFAMGGRVSEIGFSLLAIVWLGITIESVRAVLKGNLRKHKLFMILSYAMTFAAIPQRTLLLSANFTDIPFIDIYRLSAWLPWILNLAIGYLIFYISESRKIIPIDSRA